jgi:hypothetical protein
MSEIISLAAARRQRMGLRLAADNRPAIPRPRFSCGDFVRVKSTGRTGWISRQIAGTSGLLLEVRVSGVAMMVAACEVEPLGAA